MSGEATATTTTTTDGAQGAQGQAGQQGQQQGDQAQQTTGTQGQQQSVQQGATTETKTGAQVPEKYELQLPADAALDKGVIEKTAAFAREQGFSNDQAQKVLELLNTQATEGKAASQEALKAASAQWQQQTRDDKEIGGANFDASVAHARRAIEKFASPGLKEALNQTGLGNHPELVRMLAKIGKAMSEDTLLSGGHNPPQRKRDADIFYGTNQTQ